MSVKSRRKDAAAQSRREARARAAKRAFSILMAGVVMVGLVVIGLMGWKPMVERTRAGLLHDQEKLTVAIDWPASPREDGTLGPTWLPEDIRNSLLALAQHELESISDPFSNDALKRVGEAVLATGWLKSITSVRAEQGVVRVVGEWRIPWAVVRWSGHDRLVARDGAVLPPEFAANQSGFRVIEGAMEGPTMTGDSIALGERWPGKDVQAGIELLATLSPYRWWDQVQGVDVSEYAGDKRLIITTRFGGKVVWGAAPDDFVPWEQPVNVKLQRLEHLASAKGRIDGGETRLWISGEKILIDRVVDAPAVARMDASGAAHDGR